MKRARNTARKRGKSSASHRALPSHLFSGSGYDRKGLARAIEACARNGKDIHLIAIGSDRRPAAFKTLADRLGLDARFHLIGPVADPVPYYAAADVLILPTVYDPFPSTVIEALACGLPVVTTTGCGARDLAAKLDPLLVCGTFDMRWSGERIAARVETC